MCSAPPSNPIIAAAPAAVEAVGRPSYTPVAAEPPAPAPLPEPVKPAVEALNQVKVNRQGRGGGGSRSTTVLGSPAGLMAGEFTKKTLLGQ